MKNFILIAFLTLNLNVFTQTIPETHLDFYFDLEMEPFDKKFKLLDKAIKKNPNDPWYYWMYAGVYNMMGDDAKTIECYEKALLIDPNFSGGHASYSRFLYNKEDPKLDQALLYINKAIEFEPNSSYYHIDRGNIYFQLKKYDLAIENANSELTIEGSDPFTAYQLIVECLLAQNKKTEVNDFITKHDMSQNSGIMSLDFILLIGSLYADLGDEKKACASYESAASTCEMTLQELPDEIKEKLKTCK